MISIDDSISGANRVLRCLQSAAAAVRAGSAVAGNCPLVSMVVGHHGS